MRNNSIVNSLCTLLVRIALIFALGMVIPKQASCYYSAQVRATAGAVTETNGGSGVLEPGPADVRERTPEDILDPVVRVGWAHSEASLYEGKISGFAYSESYSSDTYSQRTYVVTFIQDTLEFHIPAGEYPEEDYPDGLEVTLYGRVKGLLSSNSWSDEPEWNFTLPDSYIYYKTFIGSPSQIPKGIFEFSYWNTDYRYVDKRYAVKLTLVEPNESVPTDRTVSKSVSQSMTLQCGSRDAFNPSWVGANFFALWLRLEVPAGVTWASESGVLFDQSPIPSDFSGDGDVDGSDLAEFVDFYDTDSYPEADLNEDGVVNTEDVAEFAENFGLCVACNYLLIKPRAMPERP